MLTMSLPMNADDVAEQQLAQRGGGLGFFAAGLFATGLFATGFFARAAARSPES